MSTIKRIAIFFLTILLLAPVAVFAQARHGRPTAEANRSLT